MKSCQGIANGPAFCIERCTCSTPRLALRFASPAAKAEMPSRGASARASRKAASRALVSSGRSTAIRCAALGTTSKPAPGMVRARSSPISTVVTGSSEPATTSAGTRMDASSSRRSASRMARQQSAYPFASISRKRRLQSWTAGVGSAAVAEVNQRASTASAIAPMPFSAHEPRARLPILGWRKRRRGRHQDEALDAAPDAGWRAPGQ